jgi:hypothetical protein
MVLSVSPQDAMVVHATVLFTRGLFLYRHYIDTYPDVMRAGMDPLEHYCRHGWLEGRSPNPYFDPAWYNATYLGDRPIDPLLDYCQRQDAEDVRPNPYFVPAWYRRRHQAGPEQEIDPLLHYITAGERRGACPAPWFDTGWYRAQHRLGAKESPLLHFLRRRHSGQVSPLPEFDPAFYGRTRRDVAASGMDPFEHYILHGSREGFSPSARFDSGFYRRTYLRGQTIEPLLHYRAVRAAQPVVATAEAALRQALQPGSANRLRFPVRWEDGAPVGADLLLAFLRDPALTIPFHLLWLGADAQEQDARDDAAICGFIAACFRDGRQERHGSRPLLALHAPSPLRQPYGLAIRWRALLAERFGEEPLIYLSGAPLLAK